MGMITMACPVCGHLYALGAVGSGQRAGHLCPIKTALAETRPAQGRSAR
jgi:hypothetical protein